MWIVRTIPCTGWIAIILTTAVGDCGIYKGADSVAAHWQTILATAVEGEAEKQMKETLEESQLCIIGPKSLLIAMRQGDVADID